MRDYSVKEMRAFLNNWAQNTKDKIKDRILAVDAVDTARLLDSIDFDLTFKPDADEVKIIFEMVEYGKFVGYNYT